MALLSKSSVEFGPFRLDVDNRILRRDGQLVALPPKAADLLAVLVAASGTVVSKDELLRRVWPDTFVEEGNLPVTIFALRKALGDDGERYIKTIPRRGYCFVADVRRLDPAPDTPSDGPPPAAPPLPDATIADAGPSAPAWPRVAAILAGLAVVFAGLGLGYRWFRSGPPAMATRVTSVAVLPFSVVDVGAADEYLGAGLAGDVVARLTDVPQLNVRPISSSLKYAGLGQDAIDAGRALRTDAVVTGSIRAVGSAFHVSAQMTRVSDGARLWSLPVEDARLVDVGGIIADGVASGVGLSDTSRAGLTRVRTASIDAYRLYLRGLSLGTQLTAREMAAALGRLEEAVAADPQYADAYAALATFAMLPVTPASTKEKVARARAAATRALELDERLGQAHASLAAALVWGDGNWDAAGPEFLRAIALRPNDPEVRLWHSIYLTALGRHDAALEEMRLALELDPTSPRLNLNRGMLLLMARRYDEAVAQFRRTPLEIGVVNQQVYFGIGVAHAKQARHDLAQAALRRATTRADEAQIGVYLAFVLAESGDRDGAARELERSLGELQGARAMRTMIGAAQACIGRMDEALGQLERAHAEGDTRILFANVDPVLDCARSDPRFAAFVRRLGLRP
jgi:DNA-binding winged helix-turn-helix (wHTH) protein/Tfp pilus assembly protein PilF/TolB-like protein